MKLRIYLIILILIFLNNEQIIAQQKVKKVKANNIPVKPLLIVDSLKLKLDTLLKNSIPILGYRFVVSGDFNGDHITDTLYERYTDSTFQNEAPKYYDNPDTNFEYFDMVFINEYLNKISFIEWRKLNIKLIGGQLGFHYIENCGDINLDGKDELLVVKQWSDMSNLNHAYIYTLEKNHWKEIYATPVWEWQFPLTPSASMIPGMFGNFQYAFTQNDTLDKEIEDTLKAFKFINYYPDHSIEFSGMNPINIYDDEKAEKEYNRIGDQAYIKKHFRKVYINDSLYLKDIKNPAICYKAEEFENDEKENIILFDIEDPAGMVTTRIFINNPLSPFRKKTIKIKHRHTSIIKQSIKTKKKIN
ncbi:MAG: hypothetical protein HXX18_14060 [Bacteroidetes bacterium]|nr:hypothetical protein [Bacteroidota bacterium]